MLKSISYKLLYTVWAVLFALTVVLGFAFPAAEGAGLVLLRLVTVGFFVPPAGVLLKAREDGSGHRTVIRYLSLASLVGTTVLLVANICSVGLGEKLGNALYAALTVVSAPMVCSNLYALSLFLWAALLMGSFGKK